MPTQGSDNGYSEALAGTPHRINSKASATEEIPKNNVGFWQDPQASFSKEEANFHIAAGAVVEGRQFGLHCRASHAGVTWSGAQNPDLSESLFQEPRAELPLVHFRKTHSSPTKSETWESTQPSAYVEWAYRSSPWHETYKRSHGLTAEAGPSWCGERLPPCKSPGVTLSSGSTRVPSRATRESSPETTRGPSRATQASPETARGLSRAMQASPETARAPSRATQASPETARPPSRARQMSPETARAPSRTAQASPETARAPSRAMRASREELAWPAVPLPPSRPPPRVGCDPQPHRAAPWGDRGTSPEGCSVRSGDSPISRSSHAARTSVCSPEMSQTATPEPHVMLALSSMAYNSQEVASHVDATASRPPFAEVLGIRAEAAGEKARGSVTVGIRTKAVCRHITSAASRSLLHLLDEAPRDGEAVEQWSRDNSPLHSPRHSARPPSKEPVRNTLGKHGKRKIKVAGNTPLGRMVMNDPERAAKYNLVTVAGWTQNKPWPPPEVKFRSKAAKKESVVVEEKAPRSSFRAQLQHARMKIHDEASRKSPNEVKALKILLKERDGRRNDSQEQSPKSPMKSGQLNEGFVDSSLQHQPDILSKDSLESLDLATKLMDYTEKERYRMVFQRYATNTPKGEKMLTRTGMVHALHASGHTPTTLEERRDFASVQEQILQLTRTGFEHPKTNPVADPSGTWSLQEFLLLVAAMLQIGSQKLRQRFSELSEETKMTVTEVEELRVVFDRFDADLNDCISKTELKELLQEVEIKSTDDDFVVLCQAVGVDATENLSFKQFIKMAKYIDELIQPVQPQPSLSQSHRVTFASMCSKESLGGGCATPKGAAAIVAKAFGVQPTVSENKAFGAQLSVSSVSEKTAVGVGAIRKAFFASK